MTALFPIHRMDEAVKIPALSGMSENTPGKTALKCSQVAGGESLHTQTILDK